MPIGLPESVGPGGRGPETELRSRLGDRQSSVFAIPSRAAIYAEDYGQACDISLMTSDPPRKISKQAFFLFPRSARSTHSSARIRASPDPPRDASGGRFHGDERGEPLDEPKKAKSAIHPPGIALRKRLLRDAAGFPEAFLDLDPPRGVGVDDFPRRLRLRSCGATRGAWRRDELSGAAGAGRARHSNGDLGMSSMDFPVTRESIAAAYGRISPHVRRTPVLALPDGAFGSRTPSR